MAKNFLFAFNFEHGTMNDYIISFLKENKIDWFYQLPGVIAADLFGTDEYLRLEIVDIIGNRKEVYYTEQNGLNGQCPLKERAIRKGKEPCYTVKVYFENGDTITTKINACRQKVFNFYMNNIFNLGVVEDDLQRATWVEVIA